MNSMFQKTVAKRIELVGIGLHSGRTIRLEILPGDTGTGIVFKRVDIPNSSPLVAHVTNIHSTDLNTTIANEDFRIATIEHLMAAFSCMEIDNAIVKLDGSEVPVMDGSALPFVEAIKSAGTSIQNASRKILLVKKKFEFQQGDKYIHLEPFSETIFSMEIDFRSKAIGRQRYEFKWNWSSFQGLIQSRTFCHVNDINAMRKAGLALGGSLENAVVVSDEEVLNPDGLRSSDEFVLHKILDCIGDLYLMGSPIIGRISAYKSGHGLHAAFMKALWANRHEVFSTFETVGTLKSANSKEEALAVAAGK